MDNKEGLFEIMIQPLLDKGWKVLQNNEDMISKESYIRLINPETLEMQLIQTENNLDFEEFWQILGTNGDEIEEKIKQKNNKLTEEEINTIIDNQEKLYKEVIREIIKEKVQEVNKNESRTRKQV